MNSLTNLRCRTQQCQHPEDPFRLLLAVDFEDGSGKLGAGALEMRVDGKTQVAVDLEDLFRSQQLALDATTGTLQFDQELVLDRVSPNLEFSVSLIARNGGRDESNEPELKLRLKLSD